MQHGPYRQETVVNPLNGGVERVFGPLTESFAGDPLLHSVLTAPGRIFSDASLAADRPPQRHRR
ncbi:2OG-Fe dioxygenase family protein [Streptomyces sp. NPDC007251]|uniref:2OG-Fe dioxygenase family protein n=1 Tax=unclassified Streptomyces TaxID=2593676 RepID=UPI0033DCCC75